MSTHLLRTISLAIAVTVSGPAWSYDAAMAESYAKLFAPAKAPAPGKALHFMKPEAFVNKVKAKKPLVVIDIRTPAEAAVFGAALPGSLAIPINELFTKANLERIPTDKTVVLICQSGTRTVAAVTALRHIGFDDAYSVTGGFKALASYLNAKHANTPLKP